ncbi:REST corepressor 1-like [Anopheles merus]|uniref:ELM2 domain-containing protein n=1 Tax=Anopheles merus TaxID=30066 RepID=A0A182V7K5_ANOME|nr:REST corepressor 1-like [Anopheles merus]
MEMLPSDGESDVGQEKLNNPSSDSGDSGLAEDAKKSSSSTDTRPRTNLDFEAKHLMDEMLHGIPKKSSRVGSAYQAEIPEFVPPNRRRSAERQNEPEVPLWVPKENIPEPALQEFLTVAKGRHRCNYEQAMALLYREGYNLERAYHALTNYIVHHETWAEEQRALFAKAYHLYGKNFHLYHRILPNKSLYSIVQYYYKWKNDPSAPRIKSKVFKKKRCAFSALGRGSGLLPSTSRAGMHGDGAGTSGGNIPNGETGAIPSTNDPVHVEGEEDDEVPSRGEDHHRR